MTVESIHRSRPIIVSAVSTNRSSRQRGRFHVLDACSSQLPRAPIMAKPHNARATCRLGALRLIKPIVSRTQLATSTTIRNAAGVLHRNAPTMSPLMSRLAAREQPHSGHGTPSDARIKHFVDNAALRGQPIAPATATAGRTKASTCKVRVVTRRCSISTRVGANNHEDKNDNADCETDQ